MDQAKTDKSPDDVEEAIERGEALKSSIGELQGMQDLINKMSKTSELVISTFEEPRLVVEIRAITSSTKVLGTKGAYGVSPVSSSTQELTWGMEAIVIPIEGPADPEALVEMLFSSLSRVISRIPSNKEDPS